MFMDVPVIGQDSGSRKGGSREGGRPNGEGPKGGISLKA